MFAFSPNISLRITLFKIYCEFYFLLFGILFFIVIRETTNPNGLDQHGSRLVCLTNQGNAHSFGSKNWSEYNLGETGAQWLTGHSESVAI